MPVVNISWIAGRTVEQRRTVVERFTEAMEEVGVNPDTLFIVFNDVEKDHWAHGSKLYSD